MTDRRAVSRRELFGLAAVGGLSAAIGWPVGGPRAAAAATPTTPQAALQELIDGNIRYASSIGGTNVMVSFGEDLELIRQHTENTQQPFATILACADSRVPPEILFDQSIGELFVCRVAGNIATPEIIASLEYSVAGLSSPVRVIMVVGHGSCGAVDAATALTAVPGTQISALYAPLRPAVALGGPTLDGRIRANAQIQAIFLRDSSPVLSDRVKSGQLLVVAGYYDLASGRVILLP